MLHETRSWNASTTLVKRRIGVVCFPHVCNQIWFKTLSQHSASKNEDILYDEDVSLIIITYSKTRFYVTNHSFIDRQDERILIFYLQIGVNVVDWICDCSSIPVGNYLAIAQTSIASAHSTIISVAMINVQCLSWNINNIMFYRERFCLQQNSLPLLICPSY